MVELGVHTPASECRFVLGWVGMTIVMSLAIAAIDFLGPPLQATHMFTVGMTPREAVGLVVWALRH